MVTMRPDLPKSPCLSMMSNIILLIINHLHIVSMQTLIQHHLVLLALDLNLALIIAELLK